MKKIVIDIIKFITFFIIWAIAISLAFDFEIANPALQRLWWEFKPLLAIVIITIVFVKIIEKNRLKISIFANAKKGTVLGLVLGVAWLGLIVLILKMTGTIYFNGSNEISYIYVWVLASLLNVIMQELLVRGYLYQLIKNNYNKAAAFIVTTALFTLMHGGAFEAGIIAVLNVITMSIFVTLLLEYSGGLIAPIIVHFIWNTAGCILLGAVSLAADYPNILNCEFVGNTLLSGGIYKIEGSIITLIVNILLIVFIYYKKYIEKNAEISKRSA